MKIGLVSLGCPKNLVDSEVMLGLARDAGHELTSVAADADVLVVNTCAFIESAKQESVDTILEMAQHKKDGACRRLIVTGCLAERYPEALKIEIPEIDAVLGTDDVPEIVRAIGGAASGPSASPLTFFRRGADFPIPSAKSLPTYIYDVDTPRLLTTPKHYAYVKVAEGCDYKCAFCIIPTLRGRYRSRPAESIVREARALAARGVRELLLVSQDTTFYGIDRQERGALARLLRELNRVEGLEWIRLLYLYPTTIDDDTLTAMAECEHVCKYIDLPLQHASNPVLQRMKRPGTRQKYDSLLARIRDRMPGVALRTTFIVGFPGETADDIDALCGFVRDHAFDHVGVFTYSHEEGTSAYSLDDDVPVSMKTARRDRVMGQQKQLVGRRQRARVGQHARVLVDGSASDHPLVVKARLATQAPEIDASVYLTDCDPSGYSPGQFVEVEIVGAREYDLHRSTLGGSKVPGREIGTLTGRRPVLELGFLSLTVGERWACAHFFSLRASREMPPADVVAQVRAIASRVAGTYGLELFDVQLRRESSGMVLRVQLDRPGPAATAEDSVSVADCAQVSRELSAILDVEDIVTTAYILEVSSPGLDRPLRDPEDYRRFSGRRARLVMREAVDGQTHFKGRLAGVEDNAVLIDADDGRRHLVPIDVIKRANLEVEF